MTQLLILQRPTSPPATLRLALGAVVSAPAAPDFLGLSLREAQAAARRQNATLAPAAQAQITRLVHPLARLLNERKAA